MKIDPRIRAILLEWAPSKENAIDKYVQFLEEAPVPTPHDLSHDHHMLPQQYFSKFSSPLTCPWNIRPLLIRDHYKAHKILDPITLCAIGAGYKSTKMRRTTIWCPLSVLALLKERSEKTGIKQAELIRRYVEFGLAQDETKPSEAA